MFQQGFRSLRPGLLATAAAICLAAPAYAQSGEPIKIGFSMAMTGGLGPNGKSALLAQKIWEEDVNAKGACSGARSSSSITMTRAIRRRCRASIPSCSTSTGSIC